MENITCKEYISRLILENENLKNQVQELSRTVMNQRNWAVIRECILLPKLTKTFGPIGPCGGHFATPIFQIVKELLGIKRTSEINDSNFDLAKEISSKLIDVICEYDWPEIKELQKQWSKYQKPRC